jgi:serine/threonine protein kinase
MAFKDHVLGRTVAWKELHQAKGGRELDTLASMQQEARFLREARLAAQLEHPSIVPVYEVGRRVDGSVYYTMRRIEGRTLADALGAAPSLEARLKLMPSLIAMTQALAYAHSRDVLHRDVKPQNVMLGRFGETYLLDWGLAKVKAQGTSDDAARAPDISGGLNVGAVGTPSYMSPEQAAGRHDIIDHRTDVWGVGAVLYQVLTGRPPYEGTSPLDCLTRILNDAITSHQPPLVSGRRIKLKYAHQGGRNPPVVVIHGVQTDSLPGAYKRYLMNYFREQLQLKGTPIRLVFKSPENPFHGQKNKLSDRQVKKRKRLVDFSKRKKK